MVEDDPHSLFVRAIPLFTREEIDEPPNQWDHSPGASTGCQFPAQGQTGKNPAFLYIRMADCRGCELFHKQEYLASIAPCLNIFDQVKCNIKINLGKWRQLMKIFRIPLRNTSIPLEDFSEEKSSDAGHGDTAARHLEENLPQVQGKQRAVTRAWEIVAIIAALAPIAWAISFYFVEREKQRSRVELARLEAEKNKQAPF
jgi:uncharacterized membrane protein